MEGKETVVVDEDAEVVEMIIRAIAIMSTIFWNRKRPWRRLVDYIASLGTTRSNDQYSRGGGSFAHMMKLWSGFRGYQPSRGAIEEGRRIRGGSQRLIQVWKRGDTR